MRTTLKEREGNTVKLAVEVSPEELTEAFETRLRGLAREVRIPGFRPGKAPVSMVRQKFGDEAILADAIDEAMNLWFAQAMFDLSLEAVDRPEVKMEDEPPALVKTLKFSATVTVMPDVVLGEYKGLTVPKESAEVSDEEVDGQFERLRNEFAELRPVTGRVVEKGDFVTADFRASMDGSPVTDLEGSDYLFEVGGERMFPAVSEQLVGVNAGEERSFPLALPAEGFGDLSGKTVEFSIAIKEVKEKVLPRISDQWASEVSEFATLLELRKDIRERLQAAKRHLSEQRFREAALAKAVEQVTVDLPEIVIKREAAEMLTDFKSSLEARGASLEGYLEATGVPFERMIEDLVPQAANNVKTRLVLGAVAKAENLEVSDVELVPVLGRMAAASKMDSKTLEARLRKNGRLELLKEQLLHEKAADLIAKSAVAGPPEAKPDAGKPAVAKKRSEAAAGGKKPATAKPAAKEPGSAKATAKKRGVEKPAGEKSTAKHADKGSAE